MLLSATMGRECMRIGLGVSTRRRDGEVWRGVHVGEGKVASLSTELD